jgi:NADH:ubiquinone oxidoreductase subunit 3 (subunit A)
MQTYYYHYLLLVVYCVMAAGFALTPLALAWLLAPHKPGASKNESYECGIESKGDPWVQFKVQYYLYALVFVIFDIETVFIYPWAVAFTKVGLGGFITMAVFILILAESLVYAWIKGILEWK